VPPGILFQKKSVPYASYIGRGGAAECRGTPCPQIGARKNKGSENGQVQKIDLPPLGGGGEGGGGGGGGVVGGGGGV